MLLPLTGAALLWLGRIRVAVTGREFRVDDARLPVAVIADVVALDAAGKREVLGVGAHPLAFVVQRPWIGGAVQVLLDDPADPDPVLGGEHPAPGRAGGRRCWPAASASRADRRPELCFRRSLAMCSPRSCGSPRRFR